VYTTSRPKGRSAAWPFMPTKDHSSPRQATPCLLFASRPSAFHTDRYAWSRAVERPRQIAPSGWGRTPLRRRSPQDRAPTGGPRGGGLARNGLGQRGRARPGPATGATPTRTRFFEAPLDYPDDMGTHLASSLTPSELRPRGGGDDGTERVRSRPGIAATSLPAV
jgi:hypothetical protein